MVSGMIDTIVFLADCQQMMAGSGSVEYKTLFSLLVFVSYLS